MSGPEERPDAGRVVKAGRLQGREPNAAEGSTGRVLFPAGYPEPMRRAARGEMPLDEYIEAAKERPQEVATLGAAFFAANRLEEALSLFRGLCGIVPADARFHNALGATLLRLKRPAEALGALDRALILDPANLEASVNRGEAHLLLHHFEDAAADLGRAMAQDPHRASPAANRARQLAWGMHQLCTAARAS